MADTNTNPNPDTTTFNKTEFLSNMNDRFYVSGDGGDVTKHPFFKPDKAAAHTFESFESSGVTFTGEQTDVLSSMPEKLSAIYSSVEPNQELSLVKENGFTFFSLENVIERMSTYDNFYDIGLMYAGMGHVIVLSVCRDTRKFFFRHDGGSNGWDREANYNNHVHISVVGGANVVLLDFDAMFEHINNVDHAFDISKKYIINPSVDLSKAEDHKPSDDPEDLDESDGPEGIELRREPSSFDDEDEPFDGCLERQPSACDSDDDDEPFDGCLERQPSACDSCDGESFDGCLERQPSACDSDDDGTEDIPDVTRQNTQFDVADLLNQGDQNNLGRSVSCPAGSSIGRTVSYDFADVNERTHSAPDQFTGPIGLTRTPSGIPTGLTRTPSRVPTGTKRTFDQTRGEFHDYENDSDDDLTPSLEFQ